MTTLPVCWMPWKVWILNSIMMLLKLLLLPITLVTMYYFYFVQCSAGEIKAWQVVTSCCPRHSETRQICPITVWHGVIVIRWWWWWWRLHCNWKWWQWTVSWSSWCQRRPKCQLIVTRYSIISKYSRRYRLRLSKVNLHLPVTSAFVNT